MAMSMPRRIGEALAWSPGGGQSQKHRSGLNLYLQTGKNPPPGSMARGTAVFEGLNHQRAEL